MAFNLFQNIINKAKSGASSYSNYMGNVGASVYDATHNEDPTKTVQFKALQGGANLYAGVTKRLQETAQADIADKQKKVDEEGMQFAQHLSSQGYNKEQIFSALDSLKKEGKLTASPNFAERLVGGFGNRMEEAQKSTERFAQQGFTPKTAITAPISYAGDVVGGAFEPIAAAVSPLMQKGIKAIGQEENVAKLGSEWEEIRQKYPNFADFAEGSVNISSLIPLSPKVTAPLKQGLKTAGVKTLETAKQVLPYVKPNLTQQAKKLVSQADMGFRKQAEDIAVPKLSEMGMRDKAKVTGDVIETKPGLFKKEELVRNPQEALAIEEVSRMLKEGKIRKGGTELQKSADISNEITGLAEALKGRLDNTPNPVNIPKADIDTLLDTISQNIDRNPFLKAGELDRAAQQIVKNIKDKLSKDTYTPSELLDIRKQLDADIKTYKGEKAFSPDIENAFTTTLRDIRQGINNKISELVPDADVRDFLDRQSALYIARDNVDLKWTKQANSLIGRTLTKIQSATGIPRTEIIELSTALGLLGASSLAPIVAPIAIGATAIVGGKKVLGAILSPKNKTRLANVLTKLDEAIKKNPNDVELVKAKELLTNPPKNGGSPTNIRNSSNNGQSNTQSVKSPVTPKVVNPSPKPIVKPKKLTPVKKSAIIGDMETKKLIEPKFTREQATKYMEDNIARITKEVRIGKLTKEEGKAQMLELQNDMKYIRMGITPEKLKAGKEKIIEGVTNALLKSTKKEPVKRLKKVLLKSEEAIISLQKEKKMIQGRKNPLGQYSRADKFRLIQIDDEIREHRRVIK